MKSTVIGAEVTVRELAMMLQDFRVLFVQQAGRLVGSVTNGDFRRGIAAGASLNDPVTRVMNPKPVFVGENDGYERRLVAARGLPPEHRFLPVVDTQGRISTVVSDKSLIKLPHRAVVMAGGLGTRLHSLTSQFPKPMLKIGDKPVLQIIVENLRRAGIDQITISVNYKAETIKEYFGDGSGLEVNIDYLEEKERLGTAGCLSLLSPVPEKSFFVVNGDVLTHVNFHEMLHLHQEGCFRATVCLHEHCLRIPYAVVHTDGARVLNIQEKPVQTCLVSAGLYVLEPQCIACIPKETFFDMPSLFERLIQAKQAVGCYRLRDAWIDIGTLDDFHRANQEYRDPLAENR